MSIDRSEAARVAELARLALGEAELDALAADVGRILDHVRVLQDPASMEVETPDEADGAAPGAAGETGAAPKAAKATPEAPGAHAEGGPPTAGRPRRQDPDGPGMEGGAPAPPDGPDLLLHAIGTMAPDFRDGFFVVPPPPGVQAEEDGA